MSAAAWPIRILDALLTTHPVLRLRLSHVGLAMGMMLVGVLALHYFAWIGAASSAAVTWWSVGSTGGMAIFYALIRSGWSEKFKDPTLTFGQIVYALGCAAVAYTLIGPGRGAVFLPVMLCMIFGMLRLRPRQMLLACLTAVVFLGAAMLLMARRSPSEFPIEIELGHLLMLVTTLPATAILARQLDRLRSRLHEQKDALASALERIRELATRDELTGLLNRRHMAELLRHEEERCARTGQTFCVAVIDVDHFKLVNDRHGHSGGDEVLKALSQALLSVRRGADVLARWGGEEFVLLMPDADIDQALGGVERLRLHAEQLRMSINGTNVQTTVSVGLTEHVPGEPAAKTLDRADKALYAAKAAGRNCVISQ